MPTCTSGAWVVQAPVGPGSRTDARQEQRPQRRRTGRHVGDKARIFRMIAYAVPVREGQRRARTAGMAHPAVHYGKLTVRKS